MNTDKPAPEVLEAFGISAEPIALTGGEGKSFRAGAHVLKHSDLAEEVDWSGQVLDAITPAGFRVARYRRTVSGQWSFDGWFAQRLVEGEHALDRWHDVLAACEVFHHALEGIPKPAFMAGRTNPYCVADRMSWGEATLVRSTQLADLVDPLAALLRPVDLPNQVIHGDFTGNVLFAKDQPPAVIDFTPYWRPASFARAIIVVDAVTWHGADMALFEVVASDAEIDQMLLRAALRRLLEIDQQFRQFGRDRFAQVPAHRRLVDIIVERVGRSR